MRQAAQLSFDPIPPAPTARAIDLVAGMRRTLDHDPRAARDYLEQLAALFGEDGPRDVEDTALLPRSPGQTAAGSVRGGLAAWQLRRVVAFVDERLGDTIVIAMLAEVARLSSGHFCRAFKTTVGETPHSFLIRQRVRRAQTLMLRTDDTLSQIACACGLTDQAHLTRLFRRMVGETPLVWRRTWRQPA